MPFRRCCGCLLNESGRLVDKNGRGVALEKEALKSPVKRFGKRLMFAGLPVIVIDGSKQTGVVKMRRTILLQQTIGETGRSGLAISINEKTGEGVTDTSMQAAGYRQSIAP